MLTHTKQYLLQLCEYIFFGAHTVFDFEMTAMQNILFLNVGIPSGVYHFYHLLWPIFQSSILTQNKSKTQITKSLHGKLNCITVTYNGTQHGSYGTIWPTQS